MSADEKSDVFFKDEAYISSLYSAASESNLDEIENIIKPNGHIDAQAEDGSTALNQAIMFKDRAAVSNLISFGANINRNNSEKVPCYTALLNPEFAFLNFLIDSGLDVSITQIHITTGSKTHSHAPLSLAITTELHNSSITINSTDHLLIKLMLDNGANIEAPDKIGKTPLYFAAESPAPSKEIVKILLEYGAKPDITLKGGIPYEISSSDDDIAEMINAFRSKRLTSNNLDHITSPNHRKRSSI